MSGKQNKASDSARRKKCLKPDERLPIVARGKEAGKSNREIAKELNCDEATVRGDLKKLALPPEQLAAIRQGSRRRNT